MCDVISFLNRKGGCGKSTNSTNFAYCLSTLGYKVLFIDYDGQHSASLSFGISDSNNRQFTIVELLQLVGRKAELPSKEDYLININDKIDLITCSFLYDQLDSFFKSLTNGQFIFRKFLMLSNLLNDYNFIIIDNNPSFGIVNTNSLIASNHVVVPTYPDLFNSVGMLQIIREIGDVISDPDLNLNDLKLAGILISRDKANTTLSKKYKEEYIKNGIPIFNTIIPENVAIAVAQNNYSLVCKDDPKSKSAVAFFDFTNEYLNKFVNNK